MISPDLLCSVICDDVRREENGKWLLIGLFEQIGATAFPSQHPQCCVFNKWSNGIGTFRQQTRFVDENDTVLHGSDDFTFDLSDMDATCTAVQVFNGLPLPRPGKIWIEVLLDGELRQRYPVRVGLVSRGV